MCSDNFNTNVFCDYLSNGSKFQGHYCILSLQRMKEHMRFVVIHAAVFDRDKMEGERSCGVLCIMLLVEGEGEGVCCRSDLVLCLYMGHVLCISIIDGHHPVSHSNTSLSCLSARGQLEKKKRQGQKDRC